MNNNLNSSEIADEMLESIDFGEMELPYSEEDMKEIIRRASGKVMSDYQRKVEYRKIKTSNRKKNKAARKARRITRGAK